MHYFGVYKELPITSFQPEGWLRKYLEIMRDGLTGHPEVCGYPFDVNYWGTEEGVEALKHGYPPQFWGSYEQAANWVEGALRCGYLLRDPYLIKKASQPLDYVLSCADADGYLGPQFLKHGGWRSRYPHALFFRAMMSYYSATGDDCIPNAVRNHYLSGLRSHSDELEVCNLEAILWAYEVTKDERLLDHAVKAYEEYNQLSQGKDTTLIEMLSMKRATEHGVTYNKITRLGAVLYLYTGDKTCLNATINAYRKMDRDQMLVDGVPSSAEMLAGKHPLDSHETCDVNVYTWSLRFLLQATGNAEYADKIERACFNAAPGCVTSDFKALQYFSCPNQVVATSFSNHNLWFRGYTWMSYRPSPGVECCPGNVHRIMPHFASHT